MQLCALRYPGRILEPGEIIPEDVLRFIGGQIGLDPVDAERYSERRMTRYNHLTTLAETFGFKHLTQPTRVDLIDWLIPVAKSTRNSGTLVRILIEEMRRRDIAIPGIGAVERMALEAKQGAEINIYETLIDGLTEQDIRALEDLLKKPDGSRNSELAWLRQPAGRLSAGTLLSLVKRLDRIRVIALSSDRGDVVPADWLKRLAREGDRMTAQHLRRLSPLRRRAILVATVLETTASITDEAILIFDRLINRAIKKAEQRHAEAYQNKRDAITAELKLFGQVASALVTANDAESDLSVALEKVVSWKRLKESAESTRMLTRRSETEPMHWIKDQHGTVRRFSPAFLRAFEFRGVTAMKDLLKAIDILREITIKSHRKLPDDVPLRFLDRRWRKLAASEGTVDRQYWELGVLIALRKALRSGDVWVLGSRQYRAFDDYMISRPEFSGMLTAGSLPLAITVDFESYIADRRRRLHDGLTRLSEALKRGALEDVSLDQKRLKIAKPRKPEAVDDEATQRILSGLLPRIRITEVLREVSHWTGFDAEFTHLHTNATPDNSEVLLTAILADATNLGLTRMADACPGISKQKLAWTACWHTRDECYAQALARIIDHQHAEPLAQIFGDSDTSSSDGQRFQLGSHGEARGDVNARYGNDPSIKLYTHVSGQYAPFHSKVIAATAGEAAYVIDGLLEHESDIVIRTHHTDAGGVSDHVFALCHLLGFSFQPRMSNIKDRRLYSFDPSNTYPEIASVMAGTVNVNLVARYWDEILRMTTSIRTGTVSASLMLRRLSATTQKNGLAQALREIGLIERTLYTLEWLSRPDVRETTNAELNKGEARNALARAVCFHRLGQFRDRSYENQQHRASGLNLVIAAIILWNTVYLARAIKLLESRGTVLSDTQRKSLSPLGWEHINLTGDYVWDGARVPVAGEFRPLQSEAVAA